MSLKDRIAQKTEEYLQKEEEKKEQERLGEKFRHEHNVQYFLECYQEHIKKVEDLVEKAAGEGKRAVIFSDCFGTPEAWDHLEKLAEHFKREGLTVEVKTSHTEETWDSGYRYPESTHFYLDLKW